VGYSLQPERMIGRSQLQRAGGRCFYFVLFCFRKRDGLLVMEWHYIYARNVVVQIIRVIMVQGWVARLAFEVSPWPKPDASFPDEISSFIWLGRSVAFCDFDVLQPAKAVVDQIVRAKYTDVFCGINRIGLHYNKELFFQAIQEVIWNVTFLCWFWT
jgi:hypothetical protein